jgi:hypothetical protein
MGANLQRVKEELHNFKLTHFFLPPFLPTIMPPSRRPPAFPSLKGLGHSLVPPSRRPPAVPLMAVPSLPAGFLIIYFHMFLCFGLLKKNNS